MDPGSLHGLLNWKAPAGEVTFPELLGEKPKTEKLRNLAKMAWIPKTRI